MSDEMLIEVHQIGDGSNPDCWCNRVAPHTVVQPEVGSGVHWVTQQIADQMEER